MKQASTASCYICNEDDSILPLIESPCQQCKLHVHTHCFDTHHMHQFESRKCVLINTGNTDQPFIVYTSCSVCKKRFEYTSSSLIQTLIHKLHVQPTYMNEGTPHTESDFVHDEDDNIHRDAQMVVQCVLNIVHLIPAHLRNDAVTCAHKLMIAITHAPLDKIIHSMQNMLDYLRYALFTMATSGIIIGATAIQYALQFL